MTRPDARTTLDGVAHSGRSAIADGSGSTSPATDAPSIAAIGLEKTYDSWLPFSPTVEVLDDASLSIHSGELVGIVGENGSGKSTLMQILVGTLEQDAGTVERRGTIGWCPQEPLLYDRLTVRETIHLFAEGYGISSDRRDEQLAWLADRLGYEQYLDTRIDRLSGGNRQKVNPSVALLHDPDVLLLDEPYTGFDWETYLAFWDLTDDLVERGTGIGIISHFVQDRDRFDRIYELQDGILESSTLEDGQRSGVEGEGTSENADYPEQAGGVIDDNGGTEGP
ncbi:ABC transporter ATP-binding protein [Natranaeroarchaeum aerophilus]|uniref:ABC transporter ATP-binding protein n=1 Tax=Natranaeroarchaeum aerophilus TaxID=2917711 RepID=A0AAE3FT07_9EURY|nr:ABC transporter ATP-binding protein [Natranaeroarchaeum aerophilus]MCL9814505.1 ABC transporter ATP-binding protein [Natranaeroarchaeum aerophilus]